jgi:hypothetical protein
VVIPISFFSSIQIGNVGYCETMFNLVAKPFVPRPPQKPYLWHFLRMNQLFKLKMFLERGIWLARIDQFKDELEGTLPQHNLGLLNKLMSPEMAAETIQLYADDAKRGYASCWHASDGDPNERMWREKFGNRGKAIALRTSPELLRAAIARSLGTDGPCYLNEIRYIDHGVDDIPEAHTREVAYVVQRKFDYQEEVRLYLHIFSNAAYSVLPGQQLSADIPIVRTAKSHEVVRYKWEIVGNIPEQLGAELHDSNDGKAIILPVAAEDFIDEVLVGARVSDSELETLMEMLRGTALFERVRTVGSRED